MLPSVWLVVLDMMLALIIAIIKYTSMGVGTRIRVGMNVRCNVTAFSLIIHLILSLGLIFARAILRVDTNGTRIRMCFHPYYCLHVITLF